MGTADLKAWPELCEGRGNGQVGRGKRNGERGGGGRLVAVPTAVSGREAQFQFQLQFHLKMAS